MLFKFFSVFSVFVGGDKLDEVMLNSSGNITVFVVLLFDSAPVCRLSVELLKLLLLPSVVAFDSVKLSVFSEDSSGVVDVCHKVEETENKFLLISVEFALSVVKLDSLEKCMLVVFCGVVSSCFGMLVARPAELVCVASTPDTPTSVIAPVVSAKCVCPVRGLFLSVVIALDDTLTLVLSRSMTVVSETSSSSDELISVDVCVVKKSAVVSENWSDRSVFLCAVVLLLSSVTVSFVVPLVTDPNDDEIATT